MEHLHTLTSLFDPSRIAFVSGPSPAPEWVEELGRKLGESKAQVRRIVLAPRAESATEGARAPDHGIGVDLAVLAVDSAHVLDALREAIVLGARAAMLLCQTPPPAVTEPLLAMAREARVRLLGPGSLGFARPPRRLDAGRLGALPPPGNVALVSQSGVLGGAILDWAGDTAIGFSLAVSLGAELDIDVAQVLDFLANDPSTKAVVVYLEAVRDSRSFMSALRALASVKPVVVLKGGRDAASRPTARTHSGAIVGSDAIYSAALRRAGAVQVRLFTQLFTAVRYLASRNWPLGKRLAMIGNGNGPLVLASDQAWFANIRLLPYTEPTRRRLEAALPGVEISNPLNLGLEASAEDYASALEAIAYDPESDAMLALLSPFAGVDAPQITERIARIAGTLGKPLFACWLGDNSTRPLRAWLDAAGVPVYRTPEAAVDAFSTVATFYQNQLLLQQTPRSLSDMTAPDVARARAVLDAALAEGREVLTELESKTLLDAFHVPVNRTVLAASRDEAVAAADRIGYPVAMKISSSDVAHKSDVGGVSLNVRNANEVREQYDAILQSVRAARPAARIQGVTLQPMKLGRHGRELYVGVFRDPLFGPVIAFGTGGTRVEIHRDTTVEFPPLNSFLARSMIARTRVARTLGEYGDAPAVDLEALERLLVRVSEMVCELPQLAELDINPIIADAGGLIAVDARAVADAKLPAREPHDQRRYAHMAIMPYPSELVRRCTLRDGRAYTIRPIQAEDGERLQRFVRALSEQSRYFRFISALNELSPRMLVRYTQIDYDRELALVAVLPGEKGESIMDEPIMDESIIGVVRYLLNPDRRSCEFAIAIADEMQRQGLGTTLMRAIVEHARKRGLERIEGFVLAANAPMMRLMQALGFSVQTDRDDPALKRVWRDLD
ncbi:MAG: bifunctional acetate--CoA ligase family protein/GNAT family N-acetyltransferase [Burkholderiaceae bacterium]|nr:bifunctional acetate--CoA ligase family protein/GNAT family N-acetyltransferase [Burkholderiaceae bacterium]